MKYTWPCPFLKKNVRLHFILVFFFFFIRRVRALLGSDDVALFADMGKDELDGGGRLELVLRHDNPHI